MWLIDALLVFFSRIAISQITGGPRGGATWVPASPALWEEVVSGLTLLVDAASGGYLQYAGYGCEPIKQAHVALLHFPWEHDMPAPLAQANRSYYGPWVAPGGTAMSNAVNAVPRPWAGKI